MKCKNGFYTCQFKGDLSYCNSCEEGNNYQMKEDNRKNNKGQPKKPEQDKKVPLTFHVKRRNKERIKAQIIDKVKELDSSLSLSDHIDKHGGPY